MRRRYKIRQAFTLLETLVVLAVIAILAAILLPVFQRAKREARITDSMQRLHQDWVALTLYHNDEDGYPAFLPLLYSLKAGKFYGLGSRDWQSACGPHPSRPQAFFLHIDAESDEAQILSQYGDPVLLSDDQCNDASVDLTSFYRTKLVLGVRVSGTLEKRRGKGIVDQDFFRD